MTDNFNLATRRGFSCYKRRGVFDAYKQYVENAVTLWINDGCICLGFCLCQGKVSEKFREKLETETNYSQEELDRIIEIASSHSDDNDIDSLYEFVDNISENLQ
ncbi:flavodoxin family protein [Porcipelethomonas sp.]|uniref:flavodoxin family protein n=1 Tax=Porcipelethomonas sp. TaxID=2981675 RepID=UPI003EF7BBF9